MSLLSRLFGSREHKPDPVTAEDYNGFRIIPEPIAEGSTYRISARIEKEIGGETMVHKLIRADTLQSHDEAKAASLNKAKQAIDQQGDALFSS